MDRKRRLMENNNGWPLRSQLFDGAPFRLPLLSTAVPASAATGTTATFTRATTAMVQNNDGYLVQALSGEARCQGERRGRNFMRNSEDFTGAGFTKTNCTVAKNLVGPDGVSNSACTVTATGASALLYDTLGITPTSCTKAVTSVYLKRIIGTGTVQISANGANTNTTVSLTTSWQRFETSATTLVSGTFPVILIATSGDAVGVAFWQEEDVTAQTTQTAGEYVSVGVPGDWLGDEHVTNGTFDTDTTGWTASSSALSSPATNLRVTNVGANAGYAYQAITTVVGTKYVVSTKVTVGTSASWGVYVGNSPGSGAAGFTGTTSGTFSSEFTATATTTYISPINTQAVDGRYTDFDNISVKPALYHGSFVDGVKCFPTDISGNPIPSTTLLGYSAEGARTNLQTYSNTAASWVGLNTTVPAATGPDGSSSAIRITGDATVGLHLGYAPVVAKAASAIQYTGSFLAKAGSSNYVSVYLGDGVGSGAVGTFNLSLGTVSTAATGTGGSPFTSISGGISSFGNGWYLVYVTATSNTAATLYLFAGLSNDGSNVPSFNATGVYVDVTGSQIEQGVAFPSSRIPTTTTAITRNADVLTYPSSGNITAAAGSVYLEFTPTHSPSGTVAFWGTYVDASNYTAILHDATNLIFRKRIAGINYDATIANAFVSGTTYKVCGTWGAAGVTITLNGTDGTPSADTTAAQIAATMQWGADGNSLQQPFASVRNCRDWLRQLSSSERRAITA